MPYNQLYFWLGHGRSSIRRLNTSQVLGNSVPETAISGNVDEIATTCGKVGSHWRFFRANARTTNRLSQESGPILWSCHLAAEDEVVNYAGMLRQTSED
jgi:hypothetical protein